VRKLDVIIRKDGLEINGSVRQQSQVQKENEKKTNKQTKKNNLFKKIKTKR